jgi:catalase
VARYPQFFRTLRANAGATRVPVSYATVGYHALHAYRWVDADGGEKFVRYHWVPQAGEQFLSSRAAQSKNADFLTDEMKARLADGPVLFDLQVQIAGAKDSTTDPSAPWASTNTVTVGTLQITQPDSDRESSGHIVVFDPMRVTDGIEPSDDPVLQFRSSAYSVSVKDRTGVSRGPEAP